MREFHGRCHCGAVHFSIKSDLTTVTRCNCSLCRRKGALMHRVAGDGFTLVAGEEALTLYQFHTRTAKHYFCKVCGIYTFHRPRVAPDMVSVNVGCLEGVDPASLSPDLVDGAAYP